MSDSDDDSDDSNDDPTAILLSDSTDTDDMEDILFA
jgi:hypothetical protein